MPQRYWQTKTCDVCGYEETTNDRETQFPCIRWIDLSIDTVDGEYIYARDNNTDLIFCSYACLKKYANTLVPTLSMPVLPKEA